MVTTWSTNRRGQAGIVLLTISLAISGCERESPNAPAGVLTSHDAQQAGGIIFAANCAICHGVNGDGRGQRREGMNPAPADLTLPPWSEEANAGRTFLAIRNGVPGTAMPSWLMFKGREIWDLVAYIHKMQHGATSTE